MCRVAYRYPGKLCESLGVLWVHVGYLLHGIPRHRIHQSRCLLEGGLDATCYGKRLELDGRYTVAVNL